MLCCQMLGDECMACTAVSCTEQVASRIKDAVATATTIYPELGRLGILELSMAELLPPFVAFFFFYVRCLYLHIHMQTHTHTLLASLCPSRGKQGSQQHISGMCSTPFQIQRVTLIHTRNMGYR